MVTLRDIAKATGVSVGTVSKVISRSSEIGRINPRTIRRIRQLASELGYRPNVNARALVNRRSMTLGVYVAPHPGGRIDSLYVSPIIEGICESARQAAYDVMLIDFGHLDEGLDASREKFLSKRVDGVIIIYYQGNNEVVEGLAEQGVPLVAVDSYQSLPISTVNLDNAAGVEMVVQYLYSLGHRRMVFPCELSDQKMPDHELRREAFVRVAQRLGIADECVVVDRELAGREVPRIGPFCQEDGYWAMDRLVGGEREFTAVVCYNDVVAMGVLRRLREAGWSVPGHISVVGFDNTFLSEYLSPSLTSVSHPVREMGHQSVQMLLETIEANGSKAPAVKAVTLKPELVVRESTGRIADC